MTIAPGGNTRPLSRKVAAIVAKHSEKTTSSQITTQTRDLTAKDLDQQLRQQARAIAHDMELFKPLLEAAKTGEIHKALGFKSWPGISDIREKVLALNDTISQDPLLGSQFAIGHSFFTLARIESNGREWFKGVVQTEIEPLLNEYWFDDPSKATQSVQKLLD